MHLHSVSFILTHYNQKLRSLADCCTMFQFIQKKRDRYNIMTEQPQWYARNKASKLMKWAQNIDF